MIKISLDDAAAFDILSILKVKKEKLAANKTDLVEQIEFLKNEIVSQIGLDKVNDILLSESFKKLCDANLHIFEEIEKIRLGTSILAKTADDLNIKRYNAKKALQNAFFQNELTELKTV